MNTLFETEIPIVDNREDFETLKRFFPHLDLYYLASACQKDRKDKFLRLFEICKKQGLLDENFLKESHLPGKFHSRTWEMFIACLFLQNKFRCSRFSVKKGGPELILKNLSGEDIAYIECVAPADGNKPENIVPKCLITNVPTIITTPPYQDLLPRITNSIKNKVTQYNNWQSTFKNFNPNLPYVLAINLGDPEISWPNIDENIIHSALFNAKIIDKDTIAYRVNENEIEFPRLGKATTRKGKPINTEYFLDDQFSFISAVIFSKEAILNQSEIIGDSNFIIFNPFAKSKLTPEMFPFMRQFKFKSADLDSVILQHEDISSR